MKKAIAFISLFTSLGTLFCCALPALFVLLGAGATFASLTNTFPQLIWIATHKHMVFILAGVFLFLGIVLPKLYPPPVVCDLDGNPCEATRTWSQPILYGSLGLYSIGALFAYIIPYFMQ